ncbi:unnamed protein product, partial [Brassica rapa]
ASCKVGFHNRSKCPVTQLLLRSNPTIQSSQPPQPVRNRRRWSCQQAPLLLGRNKVESLLELERISLPSKSSAVKLVVSILDTLNPVVKFVGVVNAKEKVIAETMHQLSLEINGEFKPVGNDAPTTTTNLTENKMENFHEMIHYITLLFMLSRASKTDLTLCYFMNFNRTDLRFMELRR